MQVFVYFSSTCFGLIRPSSGAIEFIISFTNAAYGILGAARCLEERVFFFVFYDGYLGFFATFQKFKISEFECVYSTMCRRTPNNVMRNPDYENAGVGKYCEGGQFFRTGLG